MYQDSYADDGTEPVQFFDRSLASYLPGAKLVSNSAVMNPAFAQFAPHIQARLADRETAFDSRYAEPEAAALLVACHEHVQQHTPPTDKTDNNSIVALVHPLYASLSHHHLLKGPMDAQIGAYKSNLRRLLDSNIHERATVVLVDTIHHYAAATSLLLEHGKIDRVIFTENDNGVLFRHADSHMFRYKTTYIAGGYNRLCLSTFMDESWTTYLTYRPIRELVLGSPLLGTLDPYEVRGAAQRWKQEQMTPLDELLTASVTMPASANSTATAQTLTG